MLVADTTMISTVILLGKPGGLGVRRRRRARRSRRRRRRARGFNRPWRRLSSRRRRDRDCSDVHSGNNGRECQNDGRDLHDGGPVERRSVASK